MHIIKNNPYATDDNTQTIVLLSARQVGKTAAFKKYIAELTVKNKPFKKKKLKK